MIGAAIVEKSKTTGKARKVRRIYLLVLVENKMRKEDGRRRKVCDSVFGCLIVVLCLVTHLFMMDNVLIFHVYPYLSPLRLL